MQGGEQLLASAIEQIQVAASHLKRHHAMEAKMWQNKAQELQAIIESLQAQLHDAQEANAQLRLALDEKSEETERLRTMNSSLTRSLQEREQAIAKYISLNQSLKGLLDGQPEAPPTSAFEFSQDEAPVSKRAPAPPERSKVQASRAPAAFGQPPSPLPGAESRSTRRASQGLMFIKAAQRELTYADFNQIISDLNMYNKHQQTREETVANLQRLLCPEHRALFEQFLPMIGGN